jgi:hypothetical protein
MSTKRSIVKKDVLAFIETELAAGKTKSDIFEELSARYFDQKTLAQYVASAPDPVLKERYHTANTILFVLLIVTAVTKIVIGGVLVAERSPAFLLLVLLFPLVNIWLAVEVRKKRGYIYWIVCMIACLGITRSLGDSILYGVLALADVLLLLGIGGLSLYIGIKMFPKLRFGRPVKDTQGVYQF